MANIGEYVIYSAENQKYMNLDTYTWTDDLRIASGWLSKGHALEKIKESKAIRDRAAIVLQVVTWQPDMTNCVQVYHRPSHVHPATCRGCTIDDVKITVDHVVPPAADQSVMMRLRITDEKNRQRSEMVKEHARNQKLIIVQVSARVYQVVKITSEGGAFRGSGLTDRSKDKFWTYLGGEIVCRGSWVQCREYVQDNADPLPPGIAPQ